MLPVGIHKGMWCGAESAAVVYIQGMFVLCCHGTVHVLAGSEEIPITVHLHFMTID